MSLWRKIWLGSLLLWFLSVLISCNGSTEEKKISGAAVMADSLFKTGYDIRSFNLGMAREEFLLGDDSSVLENEKDLVVESVAVKNGDSIFAECSYHFEHDLFQSGEISIFSPNDSINRVVSDTLLSRLSKRYGKAVLSRGFSTWKTKSKKGYAMEIFMTDLSYEVKNTIQIEFHADLVEKPMLAEKTR